METIRRNCEITITKIDRIERKVHFKISKAQYSDLKGLKFTAYMKNVDDMDSADLVRKAGQKRFSELLVLFFEKGFPFEGQTFPA